MTKAHVLTRVGLVLLLWASSAIASQAQTFTTLINFNGTNGASSYAPLIQGVEGGLYGTTSGGGTGGAGTVFKITSGGALQVVSFCPQPPCGFQPSGGLVLATDRNLYGMTEFGGGGNGQGAIFKLSQGGVLTTLYEFCVLANCADGRFPFGSLIEANDGNLYGTTLFGGTADHGTVFKITLSGALTTLHSFLLSEGDRPEAGLVQGTDGNLYGTTSGGGEFSCGELGCGSVYKITPAGELTVLHVFCTEGNCHDGAAPLGPLVRANDGNLYGTTGIGGSHRSGTVFKVTPQGRFKVVYDFCAQANCADGSNPAGGLIQATDGSLYGTTGAGGDPTCDSGVGCGTIFKIMADGAITTLHRFEEIEGSTPQAELLQATNGILYGTTPYGGTNLDGTIFSLDVGLGPFVSLIRDSGKVGATVGVLGKGFTGTTSVSLNDTPAIFTVKSDTYLTATVPTGATTGLVTVNTPSGTLTSNQVFRVKP
jgi:uncharacterized repeat protein (TIGR03803 family)